MTLSDTEDTSTVAETETPAPAPQPVDPPQVESIPRRNGWFHGFARGGIIAAVLVVVAAAFFTIGWFASTRGEDGHRGARKSIEQNMNTREQGGRRGGTDQRGAGQWQGCPNQGGGMVVPQQGQGQIVPIPQPPSSGGSTQQSPSTQQGYLGVGVATVTPQLQQQYGLSRSTGVLVASIDVSGPASKAGVQQGDVIVSISGTPVTQAEDVVGLIAQMKAGDSVSLVIDRNGQSLTLQVTLAERSASITG
jgi:PDZ domain-containing secreted protein